MPSSPGQTTWVGAHCAQPALPAHSCVQPGAVLKAPFHLPPAEVLALDAARAERCVSCGADRTCRVWKIPEESQLIFRWGLSACVKAEHMCGLQK